MSKKITIITSGSLGDIQPYIALSVTLQDAGYKVRLATHNEYAPAIVDQGVEFFPITGSPSDLLESELGLNWTHTEDHPFQFAYYFVQVMRPRLQEQLPDYLQACEGSDLLIFSRLGVASMYAADKLGIPSIFATVQPIGRTRQYPAIGAQVLPRWLPAKSLYNFASHLVVEQLFWLPFRGIINQWRRDTLNMAPAPFKPTYSQIKGRGTPLIQAHSEILLPNPPELPNWIHTTGFWLLEKKSDYQPPEKLLRFLDDGPPPVQIGYGSMRFENRQRMMEISVSSLKKSGQRGILNIPWADVDRLDLPPDVIATNYVPYDWLFPRIAAIVHHGGVGTTQIALRAGLPNVIVPFFSEQRFWAQRVADLGAGIEMASPSRLTSDDLGAAIWKAVNDDNMRLRAQELGEQLRKEDGVGNAVKIIDEVMASAQLRDKLTEG